MLDAMNTLLSTQQMIAPSTTVVCAVSGGADSICLLHALYHLQEKLDFRLVAAHYNHQLRGADAQQDAQFVAQFVALCCGSIPFFLGEGDVAAQAQRQGTGVEETAREMRYAFLNQTAHQLGAHAIATAHTANDNVETMLFQLSRGCALRGLGGIPPTRQRLIRPLLTTTRQEVEHYLAYHGLPHREDASNADDAFSRNRIRHQVVPVLEGLCPKLLQRMGDTAALLRSDEDYLAEAAKVISKQALFQPHRIAIPAQLIAQAHDAVATRVVRQMLESLPAGMQDCTATHLLGCVALCRGSDPSAQLHLPRGITAHRVYDTFLLSPATPPPPPHAEAVPLPLPGVAQFFDWQVTATLEVYDQQLQSPFDFCLAQHKISALTLRTRQVGDLLRLPLRREKSVKRWLIDAKIPRLDRDFLPILLCVHGVAAVAGLGPHAAQLPRQGEACWRIAITKQ